MNSIIKKSGRSTCVFRRRPVLILRKAVSTKELDDTKGGKVVTLSQIFKCLTANRSWAGFVLSRELDKKKFQTVVVSPRSYFVFTPLLASTAVGTLEFRTTLESVRARSSGVEFFQGWADDVNFNEKRLQIEEATSRDSKSPARIQNPKSSQEPAITSKPTKQGRLFDLKYDKLVVAVGCYSQTFNTPGVRENAFFLKDVSDARNIRERVLQCFEMAALPTTPEGLRDQLLNFAIVGGGPTGVEFAAELFDLCHEDLRKLYPTLIPHINITIYDVAPKILPMFDSKLADYALQLFRRDGIKVKTQHHIEGLRPGLPGLTGAADPVGCFTLKTREGGEVGVGMCVWSTGLMMNPFIQNALDEVHAYPTTSVTLPSPVPEPLTNSPSSYKWSLKRHAKTGGLLVDDRFRVKLIPRGIPASKLPTSPEVEATMQDVFALGDVAVLEKGQLPATAQVANQEAKWLGKRLNGGDLEEKGFEFRNLGVMTYLGNMKAIMQTDGHTEIKGRTAWLIWRGAYLTQTISWRNKLLIPMYWAINWIFGRDISRF